MSNNHFLQTSLKVITLHTFFLSVLMSFGMILSNRKKAKNQIFFGLFIAFALIIFYFFLYESNYVISYPYLSATCLSGIYLIGPMVYFLAQYSVDKEFKLGRRTTIHLLPAVLVLFASLICVKIYGYENLNIYNNFFSNRLILALGGNSLYL